MSKLGEGSTVSAIKVTQWLPEWDSIEWIEDEHRSEPPRWFYVFSLSAQHLRSLSGVYPRTTNRQKGGEDLGIQRELNEERTDEISRFVEYGYPWSDLSARKRESKEFRDLRQPGWLPTAVIVNILTKNDFRRGRQVEEIDLIEVEELRNGAASVNLPQGFCDGPWSPSGIPPIEVIDGQHRLAAFNNVAQDPTFELPVVAFWGLDLSWQAYLFYTVNIKPKKINTSLAFDLYPLLRTEQWLEKFEGHAIYRETRAQELVDKLWSTSESPWHKRINMLGERGMHGLMATQSAWVRGMLASYIRSWQGRGVRIGGLFGSKIGSHKTVLPWNLDEQAAFLIYIGSELQQAIEHSNEEWSVQLRELVKENEKDAAFFGQHNLLNQDQGIRTLLQVTNDICFLNADSLGLVDIITGSDSCGTRSLMLEEAIETFSECTKLRSFIGSLSVLLASYDWRASACPGLTEEQRILKASFRGSGGYRELRRDVLLHLIGSDSTEIAQLAEQVFGLLGYQLRADS